MLQILHPDGRSLILDVTMTADVSSSIAVAKHPIEVGAPAVDHAERQNDEWVFSCKVTESPTTSAMNRGSHLNGTRNVLQGISGPERVAAAVAFLEDCVGELISFWLDNSGRVSVTNAMLTQFPRKHSIVRSVPFTLHFVKPRLVRPRDVRIPPRQVVPATISDEGPAQDGSTDEARDVDDKSIPDQIGHFIIDGLRAFAGSSD